MTDKQKIIALIKDNIEGIDVRKDEPMSEHCSFKIGGTADVFVNVKKDTEAIALNSLIRENSIECTVIGNGSNLLVSDKGIRGVVMCLGRDFSHVNTIGDTIYASAGSLLSRIAAEALKNSLTGFEFASGIPGSLGGAVIMNAGAYGGEMRDVIVSTKYIDKLGALATCTRAEHEFVYRGSRFKNNEIILSSSIKLAQGDSNEIKQTMNSLAAKRREKQPLEYPSAGSTFKRPEGYFAAKLIEDAGLKGCRIGGAMVSDKHAGFVVNTGGASFRDVIELISHIKETVYNKFGVNLEPEVKILGEI